jgi:hypothetical protein
MKNLCPNSPPLVDRRCSSAMTLDTPIHNLPSNLGAIGRPLVYACFSISLKLPVCRLRTIWQYIRPSHELPEFNPQLRYFRIAYHHMCTALTINIRRLPIVSGLLVPFSILMEIPGLTEHVRCRNIVPLHSDS